MTGALDEHEAMWCDYSAMTHEELEGLVRDLRSDDKDRAMRARERIAAVRDREHLESLRARLEDEDAFVREAAAEPLIAMQGVQVIPELVQALNRGADQGHDNDTLASLVADLVTQDPAAAAPAIRALLADPEPRLRARGAWMAGFASGVIPTEILCHLLEDSDAGVRADAAGALSGHRSDPLIVEKLLAALRDPDEDVRASVASTLGYLGDIRALPYLERLRKDQSARVRKVAGHAYDQLQQAR